MMRMLTLAEALKQPWPTKEERMRASHARPLWWATMLTPRWCAVYACVGDDHPEAVTDFILPSEASASIALAHLRGAIHAIEWIIDEATEARAAGDACPCGECH